MLVTAPTIARLMARPRMWAFRQLKAGRFGPVLKRRGRVEYVDLAAVERVENIIFGPGQLARAGIRIHEPEGVV